MGVSPADPKSLKPVQVELLPKAAVLSQYSTTRISLELWPKGLKLVAL